MKITHIFHSGFMLELEKNVLLFDWYTGALPEIPAEKKLFVFCSHSHGDHYSPKIWDLQKTHPDVTYILDAGISDAIKHPEAFVLCVEPRMEYEISGQKTVKAGPAAPKTYAADEAPLMRILTLVSTDMGVAFYIEIEGKRIYHAGDLNVWFWYDEPMEDNIASEKKCRKEMQFLADILRGEKRSAAGKETGAEKKDIRTGTGEKKVKETGTGDAAELLDVAFVPLDPRLMEEAPRCMAGFMEILGAGIVFPMHYWEREEEAGNYLKDGRISRYAPLICFDSFREI